MHGPTCRWYFHFRLDFEFHPESFAGGAEGGQNSAAFPDWAALVVGLKIRVHCPEYCRSRTFSEMIPAGSLLCRFVMDVRFHIRGTSQTLGNPEDPVQYCGG